MPRFWIAIAIAAAISCGGSPTSPAAALPLRDGLYFVTFGGDTFACGDFKTPQSGTRVTVNVVGTHDGETWIGRPVTSDDGVFEIRLKKTATASGPASSQGLFDLAATGTISGTATANVVANIPEISTKDGSAAVFASGTPISGLVVGPSLTFSHGYITAAMTFTRGSVTSTCPTGAATWTMNGPR